MCFSVHLGRDSDSFSGEILRLHICFESPHVKTDPKLLKVLG